MFDFKKSALIWWRTSAGKSDVSWPLIGQGAHRIERAAFLGAAHARAPGVWLDAGPGVLRLAKGLGLDGANY